MTLPLRAAIVSRLVRLCSVAVPLVAIAVATGCSHNRTSYRPIFARPAQVVAPCTNCGGSQPAVVTEEAVSTRQLRFHH